MVSTRAAHINWDFFKCYSQSQVFSILIFLPFQVCQLTQMLGLVSRIDVSLTAVVVVWKWGEVPTNNERGALMRVIGAEATHDCR